MMPEGEDERARTMHLAGTTHTPIGANRGPCTCTARRIRWAIAMGGTTTGRIINSKAAKATDRRAGIENKQRGDNAQGWRK